VSCWPDGTPKKFQDPKEEWRNWINYDSEHTMLTDELNRKRIFFWEVDSKGRLWRKEVDHIESRFGEMKDVRIIDHFFGHVQRNQTGEFEDGWPWVSYRMHERYYLRCALSEDNEGDIGAPVVFNDLQEGHLIFMPPGGQLARSITTRFEPRLLRLSASFKLYHPVKTKALVEDLPGQPRKYAMRTVPALIDVVTSQRILDSAREVPSTSSASRIELWGDGWDDNNIEDSGFAIDWEGQTFRLPLLPPLLPVQS
jgi:hypothetical protein